LNRNLRLGRAFADCWRVGQGGIDGARDAELLGDVEIDQPTGVDAWRDRKDDARVQVLHRTDDGGAAGRDGLLALDRYAITHLNFCGLIVGDHDVRRRQHVDLVVGRQGVEHGLDARPGGIRERIGEARRQFANAGGAHVELKALARAAGERPFDAVLQFVG